MVSIFISHAHSDYRIAARLHELLATLSENNFDVERSSEAGAIKSGENWRDWIDEKVLGCDVALILLTPASFYGQWVLWEAGAVAGVQYQRLHDDGDGADERLSRRVRVVQFGLDETSLGPFAVTQACDGSDPERLQAFFAELLNDYRDDIGTRAVTQGLMRLGSLTREFIQGVEDDLRFTAVGVSEALVSEWIARVDRASQAGEYEWIVASKRWINVAFLGAGSADAAKSGVPVDFRLHTRIADAHRKLGDWNGAIEQLELASRLSPNDLVVLREMGRAFRELGQLDDLELVMTRMESLDADIFAKDREGVTLRCGYLSKSDDWSGVDALLEKADRSLVETDPYLLNWQALARLKVAGGPASLAYFARLRDLLPEHELEDVWDLGNLVNAYLALNNMDGAISLLRRLDLPNLTPDKVQSVTRFYDDILNAFGYEFDWRAHAGLQAG